MTLVLPSTQSLRVFETLARCLSCTKAADELCMTIGAVSKQLSALEENLGIDLFTRKKSGMILTDAGQEYLAGIRPALLQLEETGLRLTRKRVHTQTLRVWVPPSFLDRWLLPRYPTFLETNPEVQIQFNTEKSMDRTFPHNFDAHICLGTGLWPGCVAEYICGKKMLLVASRELLERTPPILFPNDILKYSLLEHSDTPAIWARAFEDLGIPREEVPFLFRSGQYSHLVHSACLGMGLAIIPCCYIEEELASGKLVRVMEYTQVSAFSCHFVCAEERQDDIPIVRFRQWLRERSSD